MSVPAWFEPFIPAALSAIAGRYATAPDPALVAAADRINLALAMALDGTSAVHNVVKMPAAG
jgi:hypothetical protein